MRLAKGVNRIGGGYPERHVYNIAPDDILLLLRFPSRSTGFVNAALTEANNNPEATPPTVYSEEGRCCPMLIMLTGMTRGTHEITMAIT